MHRLRLATAVTVAIVLAIALAVPALGGPSIAQIAKKAAQALKLAKTADKRSKKALALAKRVQPGTNGTNGTNGTGSPGPQGPPGPPGPSGATKVDFRAPAGTGATKIFDFGGLVLTASCASGPNLTLEATSTVDNSEIHLAGTKNAAGTITPVYNDNDHFGTASPPFAMPSSNFQGSLTYSTPAGAVVTVTFAAEQGAFNATKDCWVGGWALHDPS